jgi:uncharacterized membrane protein
MASWRSRLAVASPYLLASTLTVTGTAHFVVTESFTAIVPRGLPARRALVLVSGVAELACAVLVAVPQTRRVGGFATAALFCAVFPANVQMALDGGLSGSDGLLGSPVVAWLRLPLQVPLVLWAVAVARRSRASRLV